MKEVIMTGLLALWLPILLSAVLVFVVSSLIHMASPWHKGDYPKLSSEDRVMDALRPLAIPPGDYMMPRPSSREEMRSPQFLEKFKKGPVLMLTVWPGGSMSMSKQLVQWFLYAVVVGCFAAYVAGRALPASAPALQVFRFAGVTAFVGYSLALWQMSIWYRRAWTTTIKTTVDGLIYALLTAGAFARVRYPDTDARAQREWPGGVEDPRLIEAEDGTYVLTYTQWNRDIPRLAIATSRDLVHWTKHGPAFARAGGGKYRDLESKSGAILGEVAGNRVVATALRGKYWMYFNVPDILIATSDDLVDWTPLADSSGRLVKVLSPRPGYFDSWLVEAGPPALLTPHGIVLLYNAGNSGEYGDPTLPSRVYTAGQALFASGNPLQLIARSDTPFLRPTEDYERTGQYPEGTTFVEGLVPFHGRWD